MKITKYLCIIFLITLAQSCNNKVILDAKADHLLKLAGQCISPEGETAKVMYKESIVPSGSRCESELRMFICDEENGNYWSGSDEYSQPSCVVDSPETSAPCGNTPHGGIQSRTRYQSATVPQGHSCSGQTQTRTCNNGSFTSWTGNYSHNSCHAEADTVFGNTCEGSSKILGWVYELASGTGSLPNFHSMNPVDTVCPDIINVPPQGWEVGFPGKPNLVEWFGIQFRTKLNITIAGNYDFRLHSDDGSQLIIDGKMVIDHDGYHSPTSKSGSMYLSQGLHDVVIYYFQGPRVHIALQLFWTPPNSTEAIIPGHVFQRP